MESPYNRPKACNVIRKAITEMEEDRIKYPTMCGWSLEMRIYDDLLQAGYLTDEALVRADDMPKPTSEPLGFMG